MPLNKTQNKQN